MTQIWEFIYNNIYSTPEFTILLKLLLITILSGMIGFEREYSSKPAGFRTHVLVGISAVLVTVCGIELSQRYGSNDPSRIPAQLLSGIGFIGAGTILSNGLKVKGLTTASGLLAVTCIGLTVGAGLYSYAIIATVIVYIVLRYSYLLNPKVDHISSFKFKIVTNSPKEILQAVETIIPKYEMEIKKIKVVDDGEDEEENITSGYIIYDSKVKREFNKNQFINEIVKLKKVKQINEL